MSNTYRATTPAAVAAFSEGIFEHEFTPQEEADWLATGVVELVPRRYKVLTSTRVNDTGFGEIFEAAYPVETEAALLAGGHIERVRKTAAKTTKDERK